MKASKSIPCRVPGCTHAPFDTAQGEVMHYHRTHSGKVKVRGQTRLVEPADTLLAGRNSRNSSTTLEMPKQKRKYTKKKQVAKSAPGISAEVEINYCPRCVLPLQPVAIGMVLAKADSTVNGCPRCGLNLQTVAVAMAQHTSWLWATQPK